VAYINNETGIDAAKLYKATFEGAGGQIVLFEAYDPKATEFSGMLLKLRAANPDMVHVHGLLVDTPLIIAQMRQLGLTQRVSSYSAGYNPKLLTQLGSAAEGFIVTSLAPGLDDNKNLPGFLERWNAEVKRPPNGLPYLQYNYDSIRPTSDIQHTVFALPELRIPGIRYSGRRCRYRPTAAGRICNVSTRTNGPTLAASFRSGCSMTATARA
jgi:hypothetical protein